MAKRKATKRRKRRNARILDRASDHARIPNVVGLRHAIPVQIPTCWTPEQAIAVFELVDDLREQIWAFYQTEVQEMARQQQRPEYLAPFKIDDDDLPF